MSAHMGRLADLPEELLEDAVDAVYACYNGRDPSAVTAACLLVGIRVSLLGGGTKEQVKSVTNSMIDGMEGSRSN